MPEEMKRIDGPGHDPKMGYYDRLYLIGETRVFVVAPRITPEEDARRWKQLCETITNVLMQCEC